MPTVRSIAVPRAMLIRVVADVLLVMVSALTALAVRFLYQVAFEPVPVDRTYNDLLRLLGKTYLQISWPLTAICLLVFAFSGFYTRGRAYRGRYKALVVALAVTSAYIFFGFISYVVQAVPPMPRSALVLAWAVSLTFLVLSRVWALVWSSLVRAEITLEKPLTLEKLAVPRNGRVLVIGGAGYIGSALLPKLLARGYRVRLLDLLIYGTEAIQDVISHPNLEIIQADFRQVDKVVEAMHDVDAVVHLGAIVGDPACALDEGLTIEVNLMATRMIAEVAKGSNVRRFVFASTCSVYGVNTVTLDECSALNPVSIYARSKVASERVLMSMASPTFQPTLLRFGTIYGLSGRTRFDLVVNLLTAKAVVDRRITIFGGNQWRPFVHVDDAAEAVLRTVEAPLSLVGNQTFNVGSDAQNYTIQPIGEVIAHLVPGAELVSEGSDSDTRDYKVSFAKVTATLGFTPQRTIEYGVQQVIEAIETGRVKDYHEAKYSNVKFLCDEGVPRLIRRQNDWALELIKESVPEVTVVTPRVADITVVEQRVSFA